MIRRLTQEERDHMRLKVSAYTIFKGNKPFKYVAIELAYILPPIRAYLSLAQ